MQQTSVQCPSAVMLDEGIALSVVAFLADFIADLIGDPSAVLCEAAPIAHGGGHHGYTIERHPSHDLGMNEMLPRRTDLPDAFVRVPPCLFQEGNYDLGDGFDTGMRRQMATNGLHHGIRDLSVDVELGLGGGGVADAHRLGIAIAGEPGK